MNIKKNLVFRPLNKAMTCLSFFIAIGILCHIATPLNAKAFVVAKVEITGNKAGILPPLETKEGHFYQSGDVEKDAKKLYATGYFSKVSPLISTLNEQVFITFSVIENPIIHAIQVTGSKVITPEKWLKKIQNKEKHILNLASIEKDKILIESYYHQQGYDLAKITQIQFNEEEKRLEIEIKEGEIESIVLTGLSSIQPFVVARNMKSKVGDVFNSKTFKQDRERLLKLGYFLDISNPKFAISNDQKVAITLFIQEKKSNRIEAGIEQEKLEYLGYTQWVINHAFLNSDIISGKVQLGVQEGKWDFRSYSLRYGQPWILNKIKLSLTEDIWTETKEEYPSDILNTAPLVKTKREGGSITLGIPIVLDLLNVSLRYKTEMVKPETLIPPYQLSTLTLGISHYDLDNNTNPHDGRYIDFEVEQGGNLGVLNLKGLNFNKTVLKTAYFIPVTSKSTWAIGIHAGYIALKEDIITFENENFIIGGANSLRGYQESDYRNLKYPFFGKKKILISNEYRYNWSKEFQSVVFWDVGRTFNENADLNLKTFFSGFGLGIRYSTPIGSIRVDGAFGKESYIIHIGLGQLF